MIIALLCAALAAPPLPARPGEASAAPEGAPSEPSLVEAQEAASRTAAGEADDDAARVARARKAHWAPVLRGQAGGKDDERARRGVSRGQPISLDDTGVGHSWVVVATWDLAQLIFAHDETQLALAHAHLARLRRQAADDAAELWLERHKQVSALRRLAAGPDRDEAALGLLDLTARLDALTGGLFHELLLREQADLEPKS